MTPASWSRRSVRVVLPASTWARMPRLKVFTARHVLRKDRGGFGHERLPHGRHHREPLAARCSVSHRPHPRGVKAGHPKASHAVAWLTPPRGTVLPIPDIPAAGLTTYDAKDPDTRTRRSCRCGRPTGAPNVLVVLIDDVGFGASSAFGGPCQTPNFERLAAERAEVHPLPHDRAVLADPLGAAHRPQPPLRRHGQHRRAGDVGARQQLDLAQHRRAAGEDPQPQRLQHRAVRQVPRGAGVGDEPDGPVPPVADRHGLRVLLRLPRRRDQPVVPGALRGHDAGRAVARRRRRATTSTTTCRTTRSSGCASRRR